MVWVAHGEMDICKHRAKGWGGEKKNGISETCEKGVWGACARPVLAATDGSLGVDPAIMKYIIIKPPARQEAAPVRRRDRRPGRQCCRLRRPANSSSVRHRAAVARSARNDFLKWRHTPPPPPPPRQLTFPATSARSASYRRYGRRLPVTRTRSPLLVYCFCC